MHIPDGYLSPATCATMYVAAAPFWYVALKKVRRFLNTRMVPLISVFAAFSFVIMMFNLPLPGGTTGHAIGVAIATIVLGPWGSILAVSVALLIQALFFGDGGITAFAANSFNMAIVGSFVAYGVYRLISGNVPLTSPRRILAGALAGYAAINVAAFVAAIEFGLQPLLFHDASGAPLFAPYPLHIAIPAMMIGHLTFAGMAELIVTAGVVAYLQRADPSLLKLTAPGARDSEEGTREDTGQEVATRSGWRASRKLWAGLAVLMLATPLGLLAAGTAWGEWAPEDFADPAAHAAISAASGALAPTAAPGGLESLASFWSAPIPDYAPSFMQGEAFGYIMSALIGAGLIILTFLLISWLFGLRSTQLHNLRHNKANRASARLMMISSQGAPARKRRTNFIERTVDSLAGVFEQTLYAEEMAQTGGLLQHFDPRVKVVGLLLLVIAAATSRVLWVIIALFGVAVMLALLSHIPLERLAKRVWLGVLFFTGAIALPAIFITPGEILFRLPILGWPVTLQGVRAALFLLTRVETATTLSVLLILTTPWVHVLKALRVLRVPVIFVVILGMTYRYIFVLLQSAADMFEARRSRLVGQLSGADQRRVASASVGVLLSKSIQLSSEVYLAMLSRGYRGEVYILDDFQMHQRDRLGLAAFIAIAAAAYWFGW